MSKDNKIMLESDINENKLEISCNFVIKNFLTKQNFLKFFIPTFSQRACKQLEMFIFHSQKNGGDIKHRIQVCLGVLRVNSIFPFEQ